MKDSMAGTGCIYLTVSGRLRSQCGPRLMTRSGLGSWRWPIRLAVEASHATKHGRSFGDRQRAGIACVKDKTALDGTAGRFEGVQRCSNGELMPLARANATKL